MYRSCPSVCPSVRPSVCSVPRPRGKTKRPTNTKLGRKGPWNTSTPWTNFEVKGSEVKVTAANCVVGEKSTTTKVRSACSVVKSKWFTRWQHLMSPCGSTHVVNCKDGPITGGPSTAAPTCWIGGAAYSGNALHSINEVTRRWAGLVREWVTVGRQVNNLGM